MKRAKPSSEPEPNDPIVLYSTNTWLAYKIAETYYRREHYVWATTHFSPNMAPAYDYSVPPSASPGEIYSALDEEVRRGELHSPKIEANKLGICRGASVKEVEKRISLKQKREIFSIVSRAQTRDFRPLVYVIPFQFVVKILKEAPVEVRAHPLSVEYVIARLPRPHFDIIEFFRRY